MIAYAESSAVLAWLLDEKDADAIRACLTDAERVVASTLIRRVREGTRERGCHRSLRR